MSSIRPPAIRNYEDLYQRQARTAIKQLDSPELHKNTVRGIVLGVTTVQVPHGLGKIPNNWVIVDKTAQADVWHDATIAATNDFFPLKASGKVTVSIQFWV